MTTEITLHPLRSVSDDSLAVAELSDLFDGFHPGRVLETHPAHSLNCRPPLWADHDDAERRFFFGGQAPDAFAADYRFPAAYLAAFPFARLVGKGYVVIAGDNRALTDSYSGDHVLELDGHFQKRTLEVDLGDRRQRLPFALHWSQGPPRPIAGPCLLPTHYWHFNYHHWLVDCLPRLRLALEAPEMAGCRVIVPAELAPFQRESLDLIGLSAERRLPFGGGDWQVETLLFPSIGNFSPVELGWLRGRLAGSAGLAGRTGPGGAGSSAAEPGAMHASRHLYITRADAATRRVVNEAEVIAALQPYGFEVLTLSGMSLAEQIDRFAHAELIVGPHGSGLTNLLFASPGAAVLELMPRDRVNHCFWLMANALGLRYGFLSGRPVSTERDFVVPAERLPRLVEAMLDERPSVQGLV